MSASSYPPIQSWIPAEISWRELSDAHMIIVPVSDPDMVAFLATGDIAIPSIGDRRATQLIARLIGEETLKEQLLLYSCRTAAGKTTSRQEHLPNELNFRCLAAFRLLGDRELAVLVARDASPTWGFPLPAETASLLNDLYRNHLEAVEAWEAERAAEAARRDALVRQYPDIKRGFELGGALSPQFVPVATLEPIIDKLPRAAIVDGTARRISKMLDKRALAAVASSGLRPSREGAYEGLLAGTGGNRRALVIWEPHDHIPPYHEVRWALQKFLPRALATPRLKILTPPELGMAPGSDEIVTSIESLPPPTDLAEPFEELFFDDANAKDRAAQSRNRISSGGFEAIAWYQPYHEWSEVTWGIYVDARRLDDLALSIMEDCRAKSIPIRHGTAAILAFGLVHAHELFHARVEAAASWLELNGRQPRYRKYQSDVYRAQSGTSDWLEEGLANWSAWDWFQSAEMQALLARLTPAADRLKSIVEATLDLTPAGYRDWRLGHERETWRMFAEQLSACTPKPRSRRIALPFESLLQGPYPFDLQPHDIPVWFVGAGTIADKLRTHPASLPVPARREIEKALRHFQHRHVPSRGKGSHEQWVSPDQRAFYLPVRDPVSRTVFKSFLNHVGIDKQTYVRDIRPKL